ncbi:MAG: hypothetical protein AAF597_05735 [Bacteroidota bacterium]
MRFLLIALLSSLCIPLPGTVASLRAQVPTTESFAALMDSMGVSIIQPLTGEFKVEPNQENDYLDDQLTVYSKQEKLEMRFSLRAIPETDIYHGRPQLLVSTLALNLGSNDEDAVTTVHSFGDEELAVFNADWAVMYTFRPKRSYSDRTHAQLVAAYREGVGMAYTLLLFDKVPPTVEDRQLSLTFGNPKQ